MNETIVGHMLLLVERNLDDLISVLVKKEFLIDVGKIFRK